MGRISTSQALLLTGISVLWAWAAGPPAATLASQRSTPSVAKEILDVELAGKNLLRPDNWHPSDQGFQRQGDLLVCDNGSDGHTRRGAAQTVTLNQRRPEPILAVASSKAEAVSGSADSGYSLYLDLVFTDGSHLWGQTAYFGTGTHDWQQRRVVIVPEKPIRQVSVNLLLRGHSGKASFRDPALHVLRAAAGAVLFDGVPVVRRGPATEGFQVRDVAAGSDFFRLETEALGLKIEAHRTERQGAVFQDVTLTDTSGRDRAITLLYAVPVAPEGLRWCRDPRHTEAVEPGREYMVASRFHAGANGRMSRYPLAAVAGAERGVGLGIDMARPALFRLGYNAGTGELFLAYDLGLTPEKPQARIRFVQFEFDPAWAFRAALARYYELFPQSFLCRTPRQGLWMPFAKISQVEGWQDFGFRFKEGNDETGWDDRHEIVTFRYTEPATWWMRMPKEMPRNWDAARGEAKRLAERGDARAKALLTSGYHDANGRFPARLLDTPWCDGAVWSMNSMPGIAGEVTSFKLKWNAELRRKLYGPQAAATLDGEYIDSSEGYVTDELDYRRDHFSAAATPLTFSTDNHQPAIFRGLVAFEYVRAIAADVHGMNKLMMANGTPGRLCWLAPLLDVLGTETNWNRGGRWSPMSDAELLYRRALCRGKPYCFLMNTRFEDFPSPLVEKYMKRALAYGMFPGFFSHNASQGHYFTRPKLYNRDRPLFKKYVPLCRRVAEAGWQPITRAASDNARVYVERFGERYLTLFNDSDQRQTATIRLDLPAAKSVKELVSGRPLPTANNRLRITLDAEDVAVIDLAPR